MPITTRSTMPSSTPAAEFFAAYLQDSVTQKLDLNAFVWPEGLRPETSSGGQFSNDVPEIDISAAMLAKNEGVRAAVAAKISKAAKEWGFFRIVNHGLPPDMMSRAERQAHKFFALQLDQKMRAAGSSSNPFGYAAAGPSRAIMRSWHETLYMLCNHARIDNLANKVWPSAKEASDRKEFCMALSDYTTAMNKLGLQLLELLLQGLGVDRNKLTRHYSVEGSSSARINFYPPCPKPDVTFGLPPHTDSGTLTILHQDAVGGLQVCRNGKWIGVQPKPNSFIVNIGDCLQVWSNNIYKSVEHRALVNSSRARMSLAFFYNPTDDTIVAPIKELTSAKTPAVYKPFSWAEYRLYAGTHKSKVLNAIDHFKVRQ
ncbi:probable 2-oxoglutarate-dependent dioxygenase At5g05600 [Selaginella moellendorffii]|uniref:probable 2-oxoglutarate-dependent dioxygenase At5g05600 n=1 Tax=Selaginella moellendorffii TaxID=88036 RepID=UPI000D1CC619|nr:probable 2-oxoglutarate-dependent dioxygenase At5g05600 [Selaginella moellendorffii]|eukprot:XP_024521683.1 probable 2-oxoglutarate-dependent dioxygenase At5g05600 [Selaginella moellendorffii]